MAGELTGIERELVLHYLMDGNVPVTVTAAAADSENPDKAKAAVFPVAIMAEQMTVLDQGIILLKNPPEAVAAFAGKPVRVQFYFNRLGLFFNTTMSTVKAGLALVVPKSIRRIPDTAGREKKDFSAVLHYGAEKRNALQVPCSDKPGYPLFEEPRWGDIDEKFLKAAKEKLESIVTQAGNSTNGSDISGLYLIPLCRYLVEPKEPQTLQPVEGRFKTPELLYADDSCALIASEDGKFNIEKDTRYALELRFKLPAGAIGVRTVYTACVAEAVYNEHDKFCAVLRFTDIKEEDRRFLYEKVTKQIFD